MITILYFANLKEVTKKEQEKMFWSTRTVSDLITLIQQKYTQFPSGPFHVSVNEQYVPLDYCIKPGDRVAFIPPVSGG